MPSQPARLKPSSASSIAALAVEPAVLGGGLDHRVLAADLIGEGRHAEGVLHPPDHVEIGHARLDHHHVGALGEIERDLAQRLVGVGRVHLVGLLAALAERAGRADRVAERAVERRRRTSRRRT